MVIGQNTNIPLNTNRFTKYRNFFFFLTFYVVLGVQPVNNVVTVSGEQQRYSAIHIHVSILPQTLLSSRLPDNIEQSSMCYTIDACWLFILNKAVCTCLSQLPDCPFSPSFPPLATIRLKIRKFLNFDTLTTNNPKRKGMGRNGEEWGRKGKREVCL